MGSNDIKNLMVKMNPWIISGIIFLFFDLQAQKGNLSIAVDKDTMYQNEMLKVEIYIENLDGKFISPPFDAFRVGGGPNTSSRTTMINGEFTQIRSYTYFLLPEKTGALVIEPAIIQDGDNILKTDPVTIMVLDGEGDSNNAQSQKRVFTKEQEIPKTIGKDNAKKRVLKKI